MNIILLFLAILLLVPTAYYGHAYKYYYVLYFASFLIAVLAIYS